MMRGEMAFRLSGLSITNWKEMCQAETRGAQGSLLLGNKRGCQGQSPLTGARGVLASSSTPPPQAGKREHETALRGARVVKM